MIGSVPRRVMVLTGKRGGYGALKTLLRSLEDDDEIELQLVVTDQHLSAGFGNTIREVRSEFNVAAEVPMNQSHDSPLARGRALAACLDGMVRVMTRLRPDICVLYGDRGEVLATAVAATTIGIPIAHIQGGDISGSVDEQFRHAISKLSHLHFPSMPSSAMRLLKLGEESWRINAVGDSHLDLIVAGEYKSAAETAEILKLRLDAPIVTVLQHSETTAPESSYSQMVETLAAVTEIGAQTVVVHPCSDVGYQGILDAIAEYSECENVQVHANLEAPVFWGLLAISSVLVGNSSSGIIESPSFNLPAINVGRRQAGRHQSTNVLNVGHARCEIANALKIALQDETFRKRVSTCEQPYGDGNAGKRMAEYIKSCELGEKLLIKSITY